MRSYGTSALCWAGAVDERRIVATFDQFLSLLSNPFVWLVASGREWLMGFLLSCILQTPLDQLGCQGL